MSFFYIFLILFLLIAIFQLTIKAKVVFDVKNNCGIVTLKFVGIEILKYEIAIKSKCLRLTNKKRKNKYLPLELNDVAIQEYANVQDVIFRKLYFKQFKFAFAFGVDSDAFLTATVCGLVDIFAKTLYAIFKTKKSETKLSMTITPQFNSDVIKINFQVKLSVSLFDLLWCFIEVKTKNMFIGVNDARK